jgi:intein/homing endonuclease
MLLATRGYGKCVKSNTIIVTNSGTKEIKDLMPKEYVSQQRYYLNDVYLKGENGFKKAEYVWSNGETKTIKIKTRIGYELEGTDNHPIRVLRDGKYEWVEMKDLKINDLAIIHKDYIPLYIAGISKEYKNYYYSEITFIESGFCETFDVYIPDDHSFISNGFISHNSFLLSIYTRLLFEVAFLFFYS